MQQHKSNHLQDTVNNKVKLRGWKGTFNEVMKQHNQYTADGGKVCSYATRQQRRDVLHKGFRELRNMGYKFKTVLAFRGKHMQKLVAKWEQDGLAPSTIQNRISIFRTFANWIGKHGMVRDAEYYVSNPDVVKRTYVVTTPKTWSHRGVDIENKINTVRQTNQRIADSLALQHAFGLRAKESMLLRPHLADKGNVLVVTHGTKGGRDRFVPIETKAQRILLDNIKAYIGIKPTATIITMS